MNLRRALEAEYEKARLEMDAALGFDSKIKYEGDDFYVVEGHGEGKDGSCVYVASFKMRSALQCGAIAVPYHVEVAKEFRGRGIGKVLERVRINAAQAAGYQLMLATTRADNAPQVHIMHEAGWQFVREFHNPSTGHQVILWLLAFEPCRPTFVGDL